MITGGGVRSHAKPVLLHERQYPHGTDAIKVGKLKPGTYSVKLSATDLAGNYASLTGRADHLQGRQPAVDATASDLDADGTADAHHHDHRTREDRDDADEDDPDQDDADQDDANARHDTDDHDADIDRDDADDDDTG